MLSKSCEICVIDTQLMETVQQTAGDSRIEEVTLAGGGASEPPLRATWQETWQAATKRGFDIAAALAGLVLLSPLLVVAALAIWSDSPGPILFRQRRVGRGFRPFFIFKFRTMVHEANPGSRTLTVAKDPRITGVGRILRTAKIDELPQLVNVLMGDMSLVGPRPEVPHYVDLFRQDYEQILTVRPGITDLASIRYWNESAILERAEDPEEEYLTYVLPDKIAMTREYLRRRSFFFDLVLIGRTVVKLFRRGS